MDRLYSRFPGGSVGWALLLLRLIDGIGLIAEGVLVFGLGPHTGVSEPVGGLLLGLGLVATAIVLIALLGPGGYSLEARLSGWKLIKLSSRKSNSEDAE